MIDDTQPNKPVRPRRGCLGNMRRGCLGLMVLFVGTVLCIEALMPGALIPERTPQPTRVNATRVPTIGGSFVTNTPPRPDPTGTDIPPSPTPTATVTEVDTSAFQGLLGSQLGVNYVNGVAYINTVLLINVAVEPGYNDLDYAAALLNLAQNYYTIDDLVLVMNDGTTLTDYSWSRRENDWRVTPLTLPPELITPQAALEAPSPMPTITPTRMISTPVPQPTAAPVSRYTCNGVDDLNCSDFSGPWEAQRHLEACGDEDRLDRDRDGLACEDS